MLIASRALRMFVLLTLVVGGSAVPLAQVTAPTDPAAALKGTWTIVTIGGQSLADAGAETLLTFAGDTYSQTVNGEVNERGSFKIDATKKPMTIDLVITEGADAGKTQLGVIELKDDTLTGNLNTPGVASRPADFTAQDGHFVFVAKKRK
jgi:uncharacterized protein (TIGR03067 family)